MEPERRLSGWDYLLWEMGYAHISLLVPNSLEWIHPISNFFFLKR